MVHVPLWAGERFKDTSENGILGDCIEEIDWSVGQIRDKLEEHGIAENTLVFFTSDNGPARGSAGPLRGRKGSTYEGGLRVPTVAYWPGTIPPGTSYHDTATTMDILPTFAALAGGEYPAERVDGHDISGVLKGDTTRETPYEAFYFYRGYELRAVRSGAWKLHTDGTLYNLEADIAESRARPHPPRGESAPTVAPGACARDSGRRSMWPAIPASLCRRPPGRLERYPDRRNC